VTLLTTAKVKTILVRTIASVFVQRVKRIARMAGLPEQMEKQEPFPRSRLKKRLQVLIPSETGDDWGPPPLLEISPRPQKSTFGHMFPRERHGHCLYSRIRNHHHLANRPRWTRAKMSKRHGRESESWTICSLHQDNSRKPAQVL